MNDDIQILDDEQEKDFYKRGWGHGTYELTEEHLKALDEGKTYVGLMGNTPLP